MKRLVSTAVAATVCVMSVTPAWAQSSLQQQLDSEAGATLSLNYRVPLGGDRSTAERPSYGLTLNYGYQEPPPMLARDDGAFRPNVRLADLRFGDEGFQQAQVGGFTFTPADDDSLDDPRLNAMYGEKSTLTWVVTGLVVLGVVIWAINESDDDDDNHSN